MKSKIIKIGIVNNEYLSGWHFSGYEPTIEIASKDAVIGGYSIKELAVIAARGYV